MKVPLHLEKTPIQHEKSEKSRGEILMNHIPHASVNFSRKVYISYNPFGLLYMEPSPFNECLFLKFCFTGNYHFSRSIITARVRSTREGNVLTSVCPSIHPSVCPQGGGYPYPIMLCNISQNAMRQWGGGTRTPPGGYQTRPPGQDRRSTHYTAGGMPLAFTQEDFLVLSDTKINELWSSLQFIFQSKHLHISLSKV